MKLRTSYRWFSFLTINAEGVSSGSFRDHNKIDKIESVLQLCVSRNYTLRHVRTCASNKELEPWVMILERNQNSFIRQSYDEGLTLETSAFLSFTVANLRFQLSC